MGKVEKLAPNNLIFKFFGYKSVFLRLKLLSNCIQGPEFFSDIHLKHSFRHTNFGVKKRRMIYPYVLNFQMPVPLTLERIYAVMSYKTRRKLIPQRSY